MKFILKAKKSFNKRKWHLLKQGSDGKIMLQKRKKASCRGIIA
jgi:hypothetical protein